MNSSLCSNYIYLFLIHISMFKEENSLITCVLIPISMSEKRIYSFRAAFVVALMKKRGKLPSIIWVQLNLTLYGRRRRRRRLPMVLKLHFPSINFQRGWSAFAKIQSLRKEDIVLKLNDVKPTENLIPIKVLKLYSIHDWTLFFPWHRHSSVMIQPLSIHTIPAICHGSHGYIRVNFFGRCKFLQI